MSCSSELGGWLLGLRFGEGAVVVFWRFAGFAIEAPLRFAMVESGVTLLAQTAAGHRLTDMEDTVQCELV